MQEESKVYLDNNATTPLLKSVWTEVQSFLSGEKGASFGNPSSVHWAGQPVKSIIRDVRARLAQSLGVSPLELIFTSGATEANHTVIMGLLSLCERGQLPAELHGRSELIVSNVEHPSVARLADVWASHGFVVHRVPVDRRGFIDEEFFRAHLSEKTLLVSIMMASNETGVIFPIGRFARFAKNVGALVHVDAVQGFGKIAVNLENLSVDYASFSGHKFYALKGSGVLFNKKGAPLSTLFLGSQERGRRGGTENVVGIVSMGAALRTFSQFEAESSRIENLRNAMEREILKIPGVTINGFEAARVPNTSSLVFDGIDGDSLLMSLDLKGFAVSTGSACSSGNPEPSAVLMNMGLSRQEAQSTLRVSLGWQNNSEDIQRFVIALRDTVEHLRRMKLGRQRPADVEAPGVP